MGDTPFSVPVIDALDRCAQRDSFGVLGEPFAVAIIGGRPKQDYDS
jgi:hypothetical protein